MSDQEQKPMALLTKKRIRMEEGADPPGVNEADNEPPMSRSERKRDREKKRRSDVNKGFDNLMNLLLEIDPTSISVMKHLSRPMLQPQTSKQTGE